MIPGIHREFGRLLEEQHGRVRQALAGLNQEALDWSSERLPNSAAVLACHIAGSERFWIGDVLLGDPSHRDRAAEFRVTGLSEPELMARVADAASYTAAALDSLAALGLDELRTIPEREGQTASVAWTLLHVLEHTAYHAGQMSVLRRSWLDAQADKG